MIETLTDIGKNITHYLKTHPPFGKKPESYLSFYENNARLDLFIKEYPEEIKIWLELIYETQETSVNN